MSTVNNPIDISQQHAVMNGSKWNEIRASFYDFSPKLQWRTKSANGHVSDWDREWYYHLSEGGYDDIVWLEIKTDDEQLQNDAVKILQKIHVPGEISPSSIRVYGYVPHGSKVAYL